MRATVRFDLGDKESAQRDLESAHALSRTGEYSRYTIELLLARGAGALGDLEAARRFYSQALGTVLAGDDFSGGGALRGIMSVTRETGRSDAEQALIRDAIQASWHHLRLESPIPTDVEESIRRILRAEERK